MSERTEAPTPRRIADARAEGQVAYSRELNAAAALLVGVLLLRGPGGRVLQDISNLMLSSAASLALGRPDAQWMRTALLPGMLPLAIDLGMVVFGLLLTGVAASVLQTGLLWAGKRPWVDFSRLDPLAGLRRLVSAQGLAEFIKAVLKLTIIGWVAYGFLRSRATALLDLGRMDLRPALVQWAGLAYTLALRVGGVYLMLALADYGYQRWQFTRSLRMSREEIKEEFKRTEGDPFLRGRIRQQQRRLARQRMMARVPEADVVITNPTHLAIAMRYDPEGMAAPTVLAKGAHKIAERIVSLANEHGIPVLQNIPLARALYRTVEVDQEIPPELYLVVAEVLAYVYGLQGERGRRAPAGRTLAPPPSVQPPGLAEPEGEP